MATTSNVAPIPYKTPLLDSNGILTVPWQSWFRQLFLRIGGNNASLLSNPMSNIGDMVYGGISGAPTSLPGNKTNARKFLRSLSVNGIATPPLWDVLQAGDIPQIDLSNSSVVENQLAVPNGGTNVSAFTAYAPICGGTTSTGALQSVSSVGTAGQVLTSAGAGALSSFGSIDLTGSATSLSGSLGGANGGVPSGTVLMYGAAAAPTGYLLCDGSAVSRTTYATLFGIIGTTYGSGDGSTTFNLPDMRGIFPKGAGTTTRTAGKDASGNAYAGTLGTYSQDKMQGHIHSTTVGNATTGSGGGVYGWLQFTTNLQNISKNTDVTLLTDGTNGTPRTGHTTEPQSLGLTFIIKT